MSISILTENIFKKKELRIDTEKEESSADALDLSLPLQYRIDILNRYTDDTLELVNKMVTMYELSGTILLREYLYAICEKSNIHPLLKSLVACALWNYNNEDDLAYKAIEMVYPTLGTDIGTPYKINIVKLLMKNPKYKNTAREYFCAIIDNNSLNCDYRYKTILGLEHDKVDEFFILEACKVFLFNGNNKILYRILAAQYLLQKGMNIKVEKVLRNIAIDTNEEYGIRADAADVLLQLGSKSSKKIASDVIKTLSHSKHTIYENAQNVHTVSITKSIRNALEFLATFNMETSDNVEKRILALVRGQKRENIKIALNRIYMDRALYHNYTLQKVLEKIWIYINNNTHKKELKKRLVQELDDMAGTCSSGFVARLVNVISGFGDFSMTISWSEQVINNLVGRLNAEIRELDDLNLQEKILEEMTLDASKHEERKNFYKFFRSNISAIREEMWSEFKEHITDTDFDLYFHNAISVYQTGHYV